MFTGLVVPLAPGRVIVVHALGGQAISKKGN